MVLLVYFSNYHLQSKNSLVRFSGSDKSHWIMIGRWNHAYMSRPIIIHSIISLCIKLEDQDAAAVVVIGVAIVFVVVIVVAAVAVVVADI